MSFIIDPNYDSVSNFGKCTDRRPYRKTELYQALPESSVPCIDPLSAVPVELVGGNITLSGVTASSYSFDYFYYTNKTGAGTYSLGQRLIKAYTTDGGSVTSYWFTENGVLGATPNPLDVVQEGEPFPIETVNVTLNEGGEIASLSPTASNTSLALIQIKAADALILSSLTNPNDNLLAGDMVRYRLDGVAPTSATGMFAGHGSIIRLDGKEQISGFRILAKTDSTAFGSDIRPTLSITYFIGIDKK